MSKNTWRIDALNWQEIIAEALRRRKEESLTQKEHAALASVSIPTMLSFERGEQSLSLAKAFDILRVVGLIQEPNKEGAQAAFVEQAFRRWRELAETLPINSPGRFPHGWYRIDYELEGDLKNVDLYHFEQILRKIETKYTGWPLFLFLQRQELALKEIDGAIECWIPPDDTGQNRVSTDAAHCDFWRGVPQGRMFSIRGFLEDGEDTFASKSILDTTLPIWRIGEAFLHAEALAGELAQIKEATKIHMRVLYTGLTGRVLRSWANPLVDLYLEGGAARSDEALLEAVVPVKDIHDKLPEYLHPMLTSLFERFGVVGLTVDRVKAELDKMKGNRHGLRN